MMKILVNRLAWTRLEPRDLFIIRLGLALGAIIRGWDLVFPEEASVLYRVLDGPVPDALWGWAFFLGGLILLTGTLALKHFPTWLGHGMLGITYACLLISVTGFALSEPVMNFHEWARYAGVFVPLSTSHIALWLRTGVAPPPRDELIITEGRRSDA